MNKQQSLDQSAATLSFLGIELLVERPNPDSLGRVFRFFSSHFEISLDQRPVAPIAALRVVESDTTPDWIMESSREDVFIRKSAVEFFTIPATRWVSVDGTSEFFLCPRTETQILFETDRRSVTIRLGHIETVKEELLLIELIRDLFLKEIENRGYVVLHSTCAARNGSALIIPGVKGAGKTSTLVELAMNHGYSVVSGDKTILWTEQGRVHAAGWPDYPHIGLGTISKYPRLIERLNVGPRIALIPEDELWSMDHKVAIDYELFQDLLPHVSPGTTVIINQVILPRIGSDGSGRVEAAPMTPESLVPYFETVFNADHKSWNSLIPHADKLTSQKRRQRCLEILCELPSRAVVGAAQTSVWSEVTC